MKPRSRHIFIVAGEHSGDILGGKLMAAMAARSQSPLVFSGVGGEHMQAQGLKSLFPMEEIAVMGPAAIIARLPSLLRRIRETAREALAIRPDLLLIVDSPEFTHRVAQRVRRAAPEIPIVNYVSPTVWAWRPGRARKMKPYVDQLLALLPFEPAAHERLGGPPCAYVGHPMIERQPWIDSLDPRELRLKLGLAAGRPVINVLPGSRRTEVARLMRPFGEALRIVMEKAGPVEVVLPVVESVRPLVEAGLADWPVKPHLLSGDEDKFKAFRLATASMAASGTVTLELGLAGAPMVVAYRVDGIARHLRFLMTVPSVVLANLVLGENIFPEYLQEDCTGEKMAAGVLPLLSDTPERRRQLSALARIRDKMLLAEGQPSERAADIALSVLGAASIAKANMAGALKRAS
jgi:lipid-A-disaccharide synthase